MGMFQVQSIDSNLYSRPINIGRSSNIYDNDLSIFSSKSQNTAPSIDYGEILDETLNSVMEEQGLFSKGWNGIKELLNVGTSAEKCEQFIEKYKNGEISFEEAMAEIEKFASKQESSLNLFSNIATSIAAIAAVAASGGSALLVGAAAGAATKAGVKLADRATNEVKGDAIDAKQIAKDALSGAVTGSIAAVTAGTGANTYQNGFKALGRDFEGVAACATKCTRTGIITGAVAGSSNYAIDCAFDDKQDFNLKDLTLNTVQSAAIGGAVGGIMGTATGSLRAADVLSATDANVAANSASTAMYKVTNDRIRAAL